MTNPYHFPHARLFILGAGFSKPAGLPLGRDLLEDVRKHILSGGGETLEEEIREWQQLYPDKKIDLESVLAYSHRQQYLRLWGSEEMYSHGSQTIVSARQAIQEILTSNTPRPAPTLYRNFAKRLEPWDIVLTFNYDTLLEQTLDELSKPYTLLPGWRLERDPSIFKKKHIDLLKLHGSIDWYDYDYHKDSREYREKNDIPDSNPLFGQCPEIPKDRLSSAEPSAEYASRMYSRVFRVPELATYLPTLSKPFWDLVPFILPPAYDKLLGHEAILDLWENLYRILVDMPSIIVIGYSMPQYDSYAYETLGRFFMSYQGQGALTRWEQTRVPIQLVTYACSKEEALNNFPFLDAESTCVWHHGFSDDALNWLDWGEDN